MSHWKKIKSEKIYKHSRVILEEDTVQLPNNQVTSYLKIIEPFPASVTIIVVNKKEILLQKEYSYPVDEWLYQFPGGKVEQDESPLSAAVRELNEEEGLKSESLTEIGWYYTNNRRSNHKMYIFLAKNATSIKKSDGDMEEVITSQWIPTHELDSLIKNGNIINFSVLSAWAIYRSQYDK